MSHTDWAIVSKLAPKGYAELSDGKNFVVHGPIEEIIITMYNDVRIWLKWAIKKRLDENGIPIGEWEVVSDTHTIGAIKYNHVDKFEIEDIPEKGKCIRFGASVIYIDEIAGVDPSTVAGFHVPQKTT